MASSTARRSGRPAYGFLALAAALLTPLAAQAQTPQASPAPQAAGTILPAGTPASIQVSQALDSQRIQRGDTFAIRLGSPIKLGDQIIIPAGTPGVGEVLHASPAARGEPGEILIAARYLLFEGRRIPLRGFRLARRGQQSYDAGAEYFAPAVQHTVIGYAAEITPGERQPAELAEPFALGRDLGVPPPPPTPVRLTQPIPGDLAHPPANLGMVIFFRPIEQFASPYRTTVYLGAARDKTAEYAFLSSGSYIAFHVAPGPVSFSVFGGGSDLVQLEIEPGETYYVGVSSQIGPKRSAIEDLYPASLPDFVDFTPKLAKLIKPRK